ncbi:MAG: endonuclease/exonuclease/phosphatase family protein, partial [Bacteroidia bacterium]|nr:endonuclease/exonuclease/phosphatase family protein [Bacteroidia bacterium]
MKKISVVFIIMTLLSIFNSYRKPLNYLENNTPIYLNNQCDEESCLDLEKYTLTTFNIEKGHKISEAISLIQNHPKLNQTDIFLLQEMDHEGTRIIAEALSLNYLYIPINNEYGTQKDFGNSIISRGAISDPHKLILPHGQLHNGRKRSASFATLTLDSLKLRIASAHLATPFMTTKKRYEQVQHIEEYIEKDSIDYDGYLVGGD